MEIIISKDYRKFLADNKIELSDWEKATLIYNNTELKYSEKLETLADLMHETEDKELANQINERLVHDKNYLDEFKKDAENAYYILTIGSEAPFEIDEICKTYESALFDGLMEGKEFSITKRCFDCLKIQEERTGVYGTISYTAGGRMDRFCCLYGIDKEDDIDDENADRFERRSLDLPLFFRTGDIVRIIGTNMYGIVEAPDNDEEAARMQKCVASGDYSDFQVPVNTIFDGEKYLTVYAHEHVAPTLLEYATFEEKDIRKGFLEYMKNTMYHNSLWNGTGREPGRIKEVLSKLETVWNQYPDFRLGQLLLNVCGSSNLFAMEDEMLMERLEKNIFPIED